MTTTHPKWAIKIVHKSKVNAVKIVNWEDHHEIATIPNVFDWHTDGEPSEGKQAANLIAAAPELLESNQENVMEWEDLLVVLRSNPTWTRERMDAWITKKAERAVESTRAAIEKATP